jgi:hypothetical protein
MVTITLSLDSDLYDNEKVKFMHPVITDFACMGYQTKRTFLMRPLKSYCQLMQGYEFLKSMFPSGSGFHKSFEKLKNVAVVKRQQ